MMNFYKLEGEIYTDVKGIQSLVDFYNYAKQFNNCWFNLDISNLDFIDANLTAELFLYCYLLKKKNKLSFFLDYKSLSGHLNVLSRNGFAYFTVHNKEYFKPYDDKDSVIPLKAFKFDNVDSFANYITSDFINHRALSNLSTDHKNRIKNSYFEIFDNAGIHASSKSPLLACGQFFPNLGELKFTLVDSGNGFLSKIITHTKNDLKPIKTADKAISWAVQGNSTKENNLKGGNGLKKIMMYCYKNNGTFSIVSDNCFWSLENNQINNYKLNNYRKGASIHLTFRYLDI